ncbi:MAG: hypothetical protein U0942_01080 [Parvibaculum sp.]|uniref:hypothetical protein n=1 Tax=Parvibaculum sp. TaxID=2024848 RepID=UPI002AB8EF16|nr:hypothetical protein [Parvibaculum sp.]MDZ4379916.1 hypothetical protein [Parvibaculum sp.]
MQRLLRENVSVISPDTLVIAEEFGDWADSRRRIDLLGVDRTGNLVVVELKRTEDGGYMELQAIRYAAMVSTMTFDQAVSVFGRFLLHTGKGDVDPRAELLEFLGWEEPDHDQFAQDVKIVLASAEFSRELTTSVLWLIGRDIDVRCVRLQPYDLNGRVLVDVQQIIPLPEAAEYQVQVREKARKEREARSSGADFTRFDLTLADNRYPGEPKRRVIFLTCAYLCDQGVQPEKIAELCEGRTNRVWYSVEGEVSKEQFLRLAEEASAAGGKKFSQSRFYCEDSELVRRDGRTYAFSNQWGGTDWFAAMNKIKQTYKNYSIDFAPES